MKSTLRIAASVFAFAVALAWAAPTAGAVSIYGEDFGFGDINPPAPALPGPKALWAGTCDLYGGADVIGEGDEPAVGERRDCLSFGTPNLAAPRENLWASGGEPNWRLAPGSAAGAHPTGTAAFWFRRSLDIGADRWPLPAANAREITTILPPGVVGNAGDFPKCDASLVRGKTADCPPETQVGIATILTATQAAPILSVSPVYNVEPRRGKTAEFVISAVATLTSVPLIAEANTEDDFGVQVASLEIPTGYPTLAVEVSFWGVPWAASNDRWRVPTGYVKSPVGWVFGVANIPLDGLPPELRQSYDPSWGPIKPFFANPTRCLPQPPVTRFRARAWQSVAPVLNAAVPADAPVDSCGQPGFDPEIEVRAADARADSPGAFDVDLRVPQNNEPPAAVAQNPDDETGAPAHWLSPAGRATAHLKDTVVRMPEGVSINPSAANGLEACSLEQMGYRGNDFPDPSPIRFRNYVDPERKIAVACPDASTIGTLEIQTPLLDEPVPGRVYLAEQNANPFGSTYGIYLVAHSRERNVVVKLAGKVEANAKTGRLKATFKNNPQLPFELFSLQFRRGQRSPLATPAVCGTTKAEARLTPWTEGAGGVAAEPSSDLVVNSGPTGAACATAPGSRPFSPGLAAGSTKAGAGEFSPFVLRLTRPDGAQEIAGLDIQLPKGLSGSLRGIPYCPEAAIAAADANSGRAELATPSCPGASRVGSVKVGAGAGSAPLYVDGQAYLAGPYKGAPLSLVVVVPAVAGPFDLGVEVVRSAIHVNPETAELRVVSDPLPQILEGVPLRVRDIRVVMDREGFTLNPTSCEPMKVGASIRSTSGAVADLSTRFQVDGCDQLGFKPRIGARILNRGRRSTRRSFNPRMRFVVRPRPGDANIGRARVTLPSTIILDQSKLDTACTRAQRSADACPKGSIYGYAKAWSPLLDEPVEGPVYLQANGGVRALPDLLADLRGQVDVALRGFIDTARGGRLRNAFAVVPDVPVTRFQLTMAGGKRGLLVNSTDLCRKRERGFSNLRGANGRRAVQRLRIGKRFKGCGKVIRKARAARKARAVRKAGAKKKTRAMRKAGRR